MRKKLDHTVLARGEATGHAHHAEGSVLFEDGQDLLMEVAEQAIVTHEEHHTQTIPKGEYQIGGVIEFDPFENEARNVRD